MTTVPTTFTRLGSIAVLAVAASLVLSSCAANETPQPKPTDTSAPVLSGTLNGIGSSAQAAAETAWIAGFQTTNAGVTVNYDSQGSGAGRKAFIAGANDFAGSDAALKDAELATPSPLCKAGTSAIDLPVYISPIVVAYNVDGLKTLKLDSPTIAGIFKGAITKWNDPKIASQNSGATLPDAAITVVHRSDDSGTTQNFTDYLASTSGGVWDKPAGQTYPYTVGDAAKGGQGVADATKAAKNTIAYLDASAATGLGIAQLKVGSDYVTVNAAGAADVVAKSQLLLGRAKADLAIDINHTVVGKNAWPMVLVSYLIVCNTYADAAKGTLVKAYATYVASAEGQSAAAKVAGSAPLSATLAADVAAAIATIK